MLVSKLKQIVLLAFVVFFSSASMSVAATVIQLPGSFYGNTPVLGSTASIRNSCYNQGDLQSRAVGMCKREAADELCKHMGLGSSMNADAPTSMAPSGATGYIFVVFGQIACKNNP
ncbi:MAG: hypothetical protein COA62_13105 [Rhodobiaceae bacterium]|nr:MAG: hypothetical protein COA62_13105 [Rhodobiaceae bacterium]